MNENKIETYSEIEYDGDELHLFKHAVNWKGYFSRHISKSISGDVLEVGAGIGINTSYMIKCASCVTSWTMLEPDLNLAKQIKSNVDEDLVSGFSVVNGVITDINEMYDTIIYIDVLEHIKESELEIKEVKKHLRSGGTLIVLVPAYNFLYNKFDKQVGHYRRYSKKILMAEVGGKLKKERLFYLDSIGFFASLANKLVLKKDLPTKKDIRLWDGCLLRFSFFFDKVFFHSFGKSLIGIFKNQ